GGLGDRAVVPDGHRCLACGLDGVHGAPPGRGWSWCQRGPPGARSQGPNVLTDPHRVLAPRVPLVDHRVVHESAAPTGPGLTAAEARARLARDGPNRLPPPARPRPLRRLLDQL